MDSWKTKTLVNLRSEEGVVGVEDHEGVVVGVAAEEEGARVAVKGVGDESHWASHSGNDHLSNQVVQQQTVEVDNMVGIH